MKKSELTIRIIEIARMNSEEVEAFARMLSLSTLEGKQRRLLLKAIDNRKDELKDNISVLAVDSEVKMDGVGVEI